MIAPRGAIVVTRTTRLGCKLRPRGHVGQKPYTHVTIALPGTFETEGDARRFIGSLPRGEYQVERVR